MARSVLTCLSALFCGSIVQAHGWSVDSLPDPRTSPQACGRSVEGWVCSPDELLRPRDLSTIQGYISTIYAAEFPFSELFCYERFDSVPVEIMAIIVEEVEGYGDAANKVARFTQGIHNRFGVGDPDCGSGAVLVVSVNDRQVYISTGALVGAILTQRRIDAIISGMRPRLRTQEYARAIEAAVVEIGLVLSASDIPDYDYTDYDDDDGQPDADDGDGQGVLSWLLALLSVSCVCVACGASHGIFPCCSQRPQRARAGARRNIAPAGPPQDAIAASVKLGQIQRDLKDAKDGRYVSTSCPICLEDFGPVPTAESSSGHSSSTGASASNPEPSGCAPTPHRVAPGTAVPTAAPTDAVTMLMGACATEDRQKSFYAVESDVEEPLLSQHDRDLAESCMADAAPNGSADSDVHVADVEPLLSHQAPGYLPAIAADAAAASTLARIDERDGASTDRVAPRNAPAATPEPEAAQSGAGMHATPALPQESCPTGEAADARINADAAGCAGEHDCAAGNNTEDTAGAEDACAGRAECGGSACETRDPVELRCGHVFCKACITEWLQGHDACPICRKPAALDSGEQASKADGEAADKEPSEPGTPSQPGATPQPCTCSRSCQCCPGAAPGGGQPGGQSGLGRYEQEYAYRLRRLQHHYPSHVSSFLVRRMIAQAYGHSAIPGSNTFPSGPGNSPNYDPHYSPNYGPNYGPNFGPNLGPNYGPNYGRPYQPSYAPGQSSQRQGDRASRDSSSSRRGSSSRSPRHGGGQAWRSAMFSSQMSNFTTSRMLNIGSRAAHMRSGGGSASGGGGGGW